MKAKRSIRRGASGSGAAAPAAKGAAKTKRKFAMPRRIPLTKSTLAFGSGVIIFSVGFVLQNFGTHPASSLQDAKRPEMQTAELPDTLVESADLSAITPTSAGVLPVDRPLPPLPRESVAVPATETEPGRGLTALAALVKGLSDCEPLVRSASAWALGRYDSGEAVAALRSRKDVERDAEVRREINAALGKV